MLNTPAIASIRMTEYAETVRGGSSPPPPVLGDPGRVGAGGRGAFCARAAAATVNRTNNWAALRNAAVGELRFLTIIYPYFAWALPGYGRAKARMKVAIPAPEHPPAQPLPVRLRSGGRSFLFNAVCGLKTTGRQENATKF